MFSPLLLLVLFISFCLLVLGAIVIAKNARTQTNRLFSYFVFALSLWIVSNYFSNDFSLSYEMALLANHLVLFFSGLALLVLYRFSVFLTGNSFLRKFDIVFFISLAVMLTTLTPLVVKSIEKQDAVYAIEFGPLSTLYFLILAFSAISTFVVLVVAIRKSTGSQRQRLRTVLGSLVATIIVTMLTNVILPVITGSFALTNLGPLSTLILVAGLFYSIVRHKLFDIRLIVARTLGYVLSITMLVSLFTLASGIVSVYLEESFGVGLVRVINALLLTFAALVFRPTKLFFDRVTNRLFYRDAYDTQVFLDDLNRVLVQSVDIKPLLEEISRVIESNIKSNYCVFGIRKTSYFPRRVIGTFNKSVDEDDIKAIREDIKHIKDRVILTDDLNEEHADLQKRLSKHDAAVVVRLVSTTDYDVEGLGYLVLGAKKSGNLYSKQDKQVIEIIANELVIAIQNSLRFEEIEEFNVTLQQKIDDATRQLQRTNKKLKTLDETKDEFISMASHQLRTPLTSVKGYLSMVLEKDAGELNVMQEQLLNQAFVSSQRMVYLIADLLNVSRLKTGKFIIDAHPANLAEVVEGEISQLVETAKAKNMTLTYDKPKDFPELNIDETKIRQVVMNFADNAIYYTPNGGKIDIQLEDKGETIEFRVVDNGLGVPKKDQHHLFGKFYRAGNARKARPDGTGLGLFMAKKVITASGGAIIFKSEEGRGSTFGFSFAKNKLLRVGSIETDQKESDD